MTEPKFTRKNALGIGLILAVLAVTVLSWHYIGTPLIRFLSEPNGFRVWVQEHPVLSRAAFFGMQLFQIIIAMVPGEPFEIAAGYAFGAVEGTILCTAAAAAGSLLVFWLVRIFGMRLVRIFFTEKQLAPLTFLKSSAKRDLIFLVIYVIPGTPKDLLSYFAGLTDIRFPAWFLICSVGRIPSIVTSTIGGDALEARDYLTAAIVFVITVVISALGLLLYHHICKTHSDAPKA